MTGLFHAHSGLRYLVLLAAVVAIWYAARGLARKAPFDKPGRILFSAFAGLLDLQILIGLAMVALGLWYPALAGHLALMVAGAVVAHVLLVKNRRSAAPGWKLPLIAVAVALVCIVAGILAIGRGPLTMTAGALG